MAHDRMVRSIAFFTDCYDENARTRLDLRCQALFAVKPVIAGIKSDIEASFQMVDALDAALNVEYPQEGLTLVFGNIAPRNGDVKKRENNGSKFGYCTIGNAIIASTVDGHCFSLLEKLGLVEDVKVVDIPEVLAWAVGKRLISEQQVPDIRDGQFRSYEFLPRLGRWIVDGHDVPPKPTLFITRPLPTIAFIDCFGNVKTTVLQAEMLAACDGDLRTLPLDFNRFLKLPLYRRLSYVPEDGKLALTIGSSGFGEKRLVEIVINGGRAADAIECLGF